MEKERGHRGPFDAAIPDHSNVPFYSVSRLEMDGTDEVENLWLNIRIPVGKTTDRMKRTYSLSISWVVS